LPDKPVLNDRNKEEVFGQGGGWKQALGITLSYPSSYQDSKVSCILCCALMPVQAAPKRAAPVHTLHAVRAWSNEVHQKKLKGELKWQAELACLGYSVAS
jgi:hypothetical protein